MSEKKKQLVYTKEHGTTWEDEQPPLTDGGKGADDKKPSTDGGKGADDKKKK